MNNFFVGVRYLFDGFSLLTKPGVKRFVIIPLFINIIVFVSLFLVLRHYADQLNQWIMQLLPTWLHWLAVLFWIVFLLVFILFFVYTFALVANLISAPFNSFLSEKIIFYYSGKTSEQKSFWEILKDTPRILRRQFKIIGYFLPGLFVCLLLFFIPLIHALVGVAWFIFSSWFTCLTYLDYPSDNQNISIVKVRDWMSRYKWLAFGFGMSTLVAATIPIVNLFVIPAAVAGATKLWIEQYKSF